MRKIVIGAAVLAVVLAVGYVVSGRLRGAPSSSQDPGQKLPPVKAGDQVVAEARVVPVKGVTLSLTTGGAIAEILVNVGDRVRENQALVRSDAARQAAASVAQAEAARQRAQARLAQLRAGARAQDVEVARAALQAAEARYNQVIAGAREQERAQAQAQVDQAVKRADSARQRVVQAELALKMAQDDLQRMEQLVAQRAVPQQSVDQARTRMATAQADLEAVRAEHAGAMAQVTSARQQLSLVQTGARKEEIDAARADVRRAKAQLDLVMAGARREEVAAAEADVASAAAAVKQASAALDQSEIRSPLAGTVAWVGPKMGEFVAPGAPVVRVGDLSIWRIETTDLTELNIVSVKTGNAVKITLDAIPGLELAGRVTEIKPFGENRFGDIVYTVVIALDKQDPRLRWNMTASVAIETK
jgi:HlyD family secretion protein